MASSGRNESGEESLNSRDRPAYILESREVESGETSAASIPATRDRAYVSELVCVWRDAGGRASASVYRGRPSTIVLADDSSRVWSAFLGASLLSCDGRESNELYKLYDEKRMIVKHIDTICFAYGKRQSN